MDGAKKLLNETDDWLEKYIHDYFANLDKLSYSAIKTDPYDFLKTRIMKVPSYFQTSSGGFGAKFGDAVHKDIEKLLKNKVKITDFAGNEKITLENALGAIKELSKTYPGLKLASTELKFPTDFSISEITDYSGDVILDGKIDKFLEKSLTL